MNISYCIYLFLFSVILGNNYYVCQLLLLVSCFLVLLYFDEEKFLKATFMAKYKKKETKRFDDRKQDKAISAY